MINLIPNQEKKVMIKGFYSRLVVVVLFALSLVMFLATTALLPAYFISSGKKSFFNEVLNVERMKEIDKINQEIISVVSKFDQKLSILEKIPRNKFVVSERIVKEVLFKKVSNIRINQIYFEDKEEGKKITIVGTAPSREKLASFRDALKADPLFKNVDLPISNFVKGSNIRFSLSLIPS